MKMPTKRPAAAASRCTSSGCCSLSMSDQGENYHGHKRPALSQPRSLEESATGWGRYRAKLTPRLTPRQINPWLLTTSWAICRALVLTSDYGSKS